MALGQFGSQFGHLDRLFMNDDHTPAARAQQDALHRLPSREPGDRLVGVGAEH